MSVTTREPVPPAARRSRGLAAALLVCALLLRLAFALGYWTGKPLTHDELEYLHLGRSLAQGQGLHYTAEAAGALPNERYGRAPLYPAFIAAVQLAGGSAELVRNVRVAQCLLGTLCVWLIGAVAAAAAGPRARTAALAIAAVYPPLVWIPAYLLSETLYAALALAVVLILGRVLDGVRSRGGTPREEALTAAAAGLACAAAALTRPAMLLLLPILAAWTAWRRRWAFAAVFFTCTLLAIAPWTLRNYFEYHRLVLIASEGGITFWTGNHPLSPGEGDMAANPAIKMESRRLRAEHPGLTEEQMESVYYREAFEVIRRDPAWWAGLLARKFFFTFVPVGPSYRLHSPLYFGASVVPYALVLPFGIIGLARTRAEGRWPRALVMVAASAVAASVLFFPQERFRIPVIDPTLIVGTAAWLALRATGRRGART